MTRPKTRRALAAATRVPSPGVRLVVADGRARLSVEDCDPRAVLDAIVSAWPAREPMPDEPSSTHCLYEWWTDLPWDRGAGPGFLCCDPKGHAGRTHRAIARDGRVVAEHIETSGDTP